MRTNGEQLQVRSQEGDPLHGPSALLPNVVIGMIGFMGTGRTRPSTPDLFSTASDRVPTPASANPSPSFSPAPSDATTMACSSRHVLPTDLPKAVKQLEDHELDQLLAAVLAEQKRRGRKLQVSDESKRKRRIDVAPSSLTSGQVNAVGAAFKAGVTPSRIARQFGLSQSEVRRALASWAEKR